MSICGHNWFCGLFLEMRNVDDGQTQQIFAEQLNVDRRTDGKRL